MQIPCPFLLESGDCSIYIVRPQACRKHIIFGNPSTCEYNQKQNTYSGGITKALEDITIQMSSNIFKDKFVLTKHTSTTQEIVFMVKHLTHWFSNGFKDIGLYQSFLPVPKKWRRGWRNNLWPFPLPKHGRVLE